MIDARSEPSVAHRGEQHDLADRVAPGQQHHQPVDTEADASRRRHPLLERLHEQLVVGLDLLLAERREPLLGLEALALDVRIG